MLELCQCLLMVLYPKENTVKKSDGTPDKSLAQAKDPMSLQLHSQTTQFATHSFSQAGSQRCLQNMSKGNVKSCRSK